MIITLLAVAFVLGIAIIVHEFGHFIVAKKSGVFVKTFAVGFGRKLLKKRIGETEYAIAVFPFGGYVKFAGELEDSEQSEAPQDKSSDEIPDSEIDPERYFINKSKWIRSAVVFAGPFANYVLALILYVVMFSVQGLSVVNTTRLGTVVTGSPADSVGLMADDEILSVDGVEVSTWSGLVDAILDERETPKMLEVRRGERTLDVEYVSKVEDKRIILGFDYYVSNVLGLVKRDGPAYVAGMREGAVMESINDTTITGFRDIERIIHASPKVPLLIGWSLDGVQHLDSITPEAKKVPKGNSKTEFEVVGQIGVGPRYDRERVPIHRAVVLGLETSAGMAVEIVSFLKLLLSGQAGVDTLGGPILIGQMAGDMARWGFDRLLYFLAFLSINLGIFNLLPVLPFDGGHLALFFLEGISRRRINPKLRERMAQGGFILLILLMAVVVSLDLVRCTGSSPGFF